MQICRDLDTLRRAVADLRAGGRLRLALVPTMGALHEGHLDLVAAGRRAADAVAASIFVNPLQFGPNEDLARYPRDEAGDLAKLRAAGCDLVWMPPVAVMYPPGAATTIEVGGPSEGWEGTHRPGHFRGVATVCAKLFLQTGADVAVFGEKDWQQLQVVRRMVRDLDMPIRIDAVPTVREPDGLAMSSRNRFLAPAERALAPRLAAAMRGVAAALGERGRPAAPVLAEAEASLRAAGFGIDYLALVEAESLRPLDAAAADRPARLIAAARLGGVRLLDNMPVPPAAPPSGA
jgi:pantoate--beta-alanine ligase